MNPVTSTVLTRDCAAVQIPAGSTVSLPAGTAVDITQTLGGSFTIQAEGGLYRIAAADSDALGVEPNGAESAGRASEVVTEAQVWDVLRTCYDPEIPVNIVDLGLVYGMKLEDAASGGRRVAVRMTLTASGCGMGGVIAGDAQQKLMMLPGVEEAAVDIVWDPPWHHSMITDNGKKILGLE
jgi:probable FeS assembly SUF system protein SufT